MTLTEFITIATLISGGIFGGITWLIRTSIQHFFTSQVNQHKLQLDHQLEIHKAQLEQDNFKFSKLHEQRLGVIVKLYKRLARTHANLSILTAFFKEGSSPEQIEKQERKEAQNAADSLNSLTNYHWENKIFLHAEMSELLDEVRKKLRAAFHNYTFKLRTGIDNFEITDKNMKEVNNLMDNVIPEIMTALENQFRKEIGFID